MALVPIIVSTINVKSMIIFIYYYCFERNVKCISFYISNVLRVFWLNIGKYEIYLRYRYCLNLIGELRKEREFRQQCCRNSTKVGERKRNSWREKDFEFRQLCYRNSSTQIPCPSPMSCVPECGVLKKNKSNCGNAIAEIGKKRKFFFGNCGNGIAKNGRGKKLNGIVAISLPKIGGKKNCCCRNLGRNLKKSVTFTIFL